MYTGGQAIIKIIAADLWWKAKLRRVIFNQLLNWEAWDIKC